MADPDFSEFKLWKRGRQYQDFEVGQHFDHHWGRTLSGAEATLFSATALRYCPLYVNAEYARAEGHPDLVVDPLLVLATVIGMSVEDLSEIGGPFLGVNNVEFVAPAYPGDTVTCSSEVLETRESDSRPDTGIVTWATEARNQHGDIVLRYQRTNLVSKRVAKRRERSA